jgi:hypothetical protein
MTVGPLWNTDVSVAPLWDAERLARRLEIPLYAAWRVGRQGLIPGAVVRVGRYLRFRPDVVEAWIASGGSLSAGHDDPAGAA